MNDDFDLSRLADIGDPFVEDASAPVRPRDPQRARTGRSPTRPRVRASRAIALGAALLYEAAWLVLRERRPDLASASPVDLALGIAIPLGAAVIALGAAARSGPRGLGIPAQRVAALALAAPLLFAVATLLAAPPGTGDPRFWHHAASCMAVTGILALGPMALGLRAFRHAFPAAAAWRTTALGAAAGGLAAATMSLACPITTAAHVIVGHGLVIIVGALVGALLAPAVARS